MEGSKNLADSLSTNLEEIVFSLSSRSPDSTNDVLEPLDSLGLVAVTEEPAVLWVPSQEPTGAKVVVSIGDQCFFEVDSLSGEPELLFLESLRGFLSFPLLEALRECYAKVVEELNLLGDQCMKEVS